MTTAVSLVQENLHRMIVKDQEKYLGSGWDWGEIPGSNKARWLVHKRFRVAESTVQRTVGRKRKSKEKKVTTLKPKKRGTREPDLNPVNAWHSLYVPIAAYVATHVKMVM